MIRPLIPSRTDDYLGALFVSMEQSQTGTVAQCIVADNGLSEAFREKWWQPAYVTPDKPFVFSQAINLMAAADYYQSNDLLVLNDDTEIITSGWLDTLENLLEQHPKCGLLSCSFTKGCSNPSQMMPPELAAPEPTTFLLEPRVLAFIAVLIRRKAWNEIGTMDERFTGYGFEDNDYCKRALQAGWSLGVTREVVVAHGQGMFAHSSSYWKYMGQRAWNAAYQDNHYRFIEKWGSL